MKLVQQLDNFLLTSRAGRTMLGPLMSIGLKLLILSISATLYEIRRSELERASSEACSRDLENRLKSLIDDATYRILERAERAKEAAVGALRSSLCDLEEQAASSDVAAAATAHAYLALFKREGLTTNQELRFDEYPEPEEGA